jgi:hypothetical protein
MDLLLIVHTQTDGGVFAFNLFQAEVLFQKPFSVDSRVTLSIVEKPLAV